jgi:hypothetical protein
LLAAPSEFDEGAIDCTEGWSAAITFSGLRAGDLSTPNVVTWFPTTVAQVPPSHTSRFPLAKQPQRVLLSRADEDYPGSLHPC